MTFSASEIIAIVSLITSFIALAKVFLGVAQTVAKLEVKVDTMWDFTLRRAKSEAVLTGLAHMNSPLIFTPFAAQLIAPFAKQLRELCNKLDCPTLTDSKLAIEIERLFGQQLLNEICIPNHIYLGACLLIAIEAARGRLGCEPTS